jgi:sodium/hydrogen exchanger-like protein 6/7
MAQLSENFIFIYLGLSLFTERNLVFKPLFILITIVGICLARWCAVFPLSKLINWVIRYRAKRMGNPDAADELPYSHQVMLFWAGLRGAVGVALAAGLTGQNGPVLRATVLVVVVLTVIIFGGTTARMLEILNIRTGVVEEIDSDDEFDIEFVPDHGGTYSRKSGTGIGHMPRTNGVALGDLEPEDQDSSRERGSYSSGNVNGNGHPPGRSGAARRNSTRGGRSADTAEQGLLSPIESGTASQADDEDEAADLDLPPAVRRVGNLLSPSPRDSSPGMPYPTSGSRADGRPETHAGRIAHATGAITQLISELSEDPASAFRQIDEDFIKPHLLLDPGSGHGSGHGGS